MPARILPLQSLTIRRFIRPTSLNPSHHQNAHHRRTYASLKFSLDLSSPRNPIRKLGAPILFFCFGVVPFTYMQLFEDGGALNPPSDAETLKLFKPVPDSFEEEVDEYIRAHPLTKSLLADQRFSASRPHMKIAPSLRHNNLTAGVLMGGAGVTVPPLTFVTADGSELVSLQHLGPALCGHPGVVHGGLLATLMDEGLARCCFPALPNHVGVTATLKLQYKAPTPAESYVVLRAKTVKVEERKAWVEGRLETLVDEESGEKPTVLVEAEALFIEPRSKIFRAAMSGYASDKALPKSPS